MLPCFSDSVAGHPSHMLQSRARELFLVTCSWVKGPVVRGTQNACFGGPSSREKHLENFSQFSLWVFWWLALATCFSSEKRMFCISKTVSLNFFSFSLDFLWLFTVFPISFLTETDPNTPQTPFLHHFFSNLQEKGMGFLYLTSFSMVWVCFSYFCECIFVIMFLKSVMLVQGFTLSWWLFIVWELVFLTLLLVFIWSLGFVHCFTIVVVSFISCLWNFVTLFVIWILVMFSDHLILSY